MKASAKSQREATRTKFGVTDSGIASEYEPQIGDSVRLLSMGGAQAKVKDLTLEESLRANRRESARAIQ